LAFARLRVAFFGGRRGFGTGLEKRHICDFSWADWQSNGQEFPAEEPRQR
jgi:hypothetical protein